MARITKIQSRRGTAATWTSTNPVLADGEPGFETDTGKIKIGDGSTAWTSLKYITPVIRETGGPTNLVAGSIVDGEYLKRSGSSIVSGVPSGGGVVIGSELIYKYTVTGSDKTSIDTGVDTPNAGSNDWTGGDLLEIRMYLRTDESAVQSNVIISFNNDTSNTNYFSQFVEGANTTAAAGKQTTFGGLVPVAAGASAGTNIFSAMKIDIPNYLGTVGFKGGTLDSGQPDTTATTMQVYTYQWAYLSTTAITRMSIGVLTAAKKLKVGSQILIYKRAASSGTLDGGSA